MQEEIFWRKEEISLLLSPLIFPENIVFHKKEKENAEKGLHEFINGHAQDFEITIEIKSKKDKIDLLQFEVEDMVKRMIEFRYNPEPAILKVSNYEELGKKETE